MRLKACYSILILLAVACASKKRGKKPFEIEDFGIHRKSASKDVVDENVDASKERLLLRRLIKPSLPLPIKVGKGRDKFNGVPRRALPPTPAIHLIKKRSCIMALVTDTIGIDRYLVVAGGELVKMKEGLIANKVVALDLKMRFIFKVTSLMRVVLKPSSYMACSKIWRGRKNFLGIYDLSQTKIGLISSRGSPHVKIFKLRKEKIKKKIYLKWDINSRLPLVVDEFDLPASLETGYYGSRFKRKGFYYLQVQPVINGRKRS